MPTKVPGGLVDSVREGAAETGGRVQEAISAAAQKIEDALEDAKYEGYHLKRKVQDELIRRWKTVDRVGRENAFAMALGALAAGVIIGYLLKRNRD